MDKDKKITRLEQKLNKALEENKKLKSENRSLKSEKRKESKKKDARSVTLTKGQQRLLSRLLNGTLIPNS